MIKAILYERTVPVVMCASVDFGKGSGRSEWWGDSRWCVSWQLHLLLQFGSSECEIKSAIGDKRTAELALLGDVLEDLTLEELISYHGTFPLWKRIIVAINTVRVSFHSFYHMGPCLGW